MVTSSRADYGLLRPLLAEFEKRPEFDSLLVVAGSHLRREAGLTVGEIEADQRAIASKISVRETISSRLEATFDAGATLSEVSRSLWDLQPDSVVVLGDRYEIVAVAVGARLLGLQLVHISGGEITLGSIDNHFRNAISALADLHFVALESHKLRLRLMGIPDHQIFVVGRLSEDVMRSLELVPKPVLEEQLGLELRFPLVVVTFHPATNSQDDQIQVASNLIDALDEMKDLTVVITGSNQDDGGPEIGDLLSNWAKKNPKRSRYVLSLGSSRYLSLVSHANCVLGNSSSGLTEAPLLGIPSVDIGDRQLGRDRYESVRNCDTSTGSIVDAVRLALSSRSTALSIDANENAASVSCRIAEIMLRELGT